MKFTPRLASAYLLRILIFNLNRGTLFSFHDRLTVVIPDLRLIRYTQSTRLGVKADIF